MGKHGRNIKILLDLLETKCTLVNLKMLNTNLTLKDFIKYKFRSLEAKIKTSSDLFENMYPSQLEGAKCEPDIGIYLFFIQKVNLGKLVPKLKSY